MKKNIQYYIILTLLISIFLNYTNYNIASANIKNKNIEPTKNINIKLDKTVCDAHINLTPKYDTFSGLYGYVDSNDNWVIEPNFSDARNFSDGVAAVDDRPFACNWGYILPDGTYFIEPKFTSTFDFNDDFAFVEDKSFLSLINKKGEYVLKTKYHLYTTNPSTHIGAIISNADVNEFEKKHKYGIITSEGVLVEPQFDNYYNFESDNFVCFSNKDSSSKNADSEFFAVIPNGTLIAIDNTISKVSEGIGFIKYTSDKKLDRGDPKTRYEFITPDGKVIKSYKHRNGGEYPFVLAHEFSEGFAAVAVNFTGNGEPLYDRWGFLKKDGTWLIEPSYISVGSFKEGVAPVKSVFSWGYINTDLTWFIEPKTVTPISKPHNAFSNFLDTALYSQSEHDFCIDKAQDILKNIINDSMSDYEKVNCIYDYLTKNVKYDNDFYKGNVSRVSYTAYGALKYNVAVCGGYSDALCLMLTLAGIDNQQIYGYANSSGGSHQWNLVQIDGNYYHLDSTWDSLNNHKQFFLKSDKYMLNNRTWNQDDYPKAEKDY